MDLVHDDRANIMEEEDRISNLPDEIINHILSFLNMKYAVQTSMLSRKWKHVWTILPHLKLDSCTFFTIPQFAKFVKHLLSHRNNHTDVSTIELKFTGVPTQFFVRSVLKYAYLHNVRKLTMTSFTNNPNRLPQCLFSSRTLKHLTLASYDGSFYSYSDYEIAWDFPNLETLNLSSFFFGCRDVENPDLFSKCVNLKDLTLHNCSMYFVSIFSVCTPRLLHLTLTDAISFPKVFNLVAPQLKTLTASVVSASASGCPISQDSLQLATEGCCSLERVNLSLSNRMGRNEKYVPLLLNMFQKFRTTKYLILGFDIIETLSLCLDQLSLEPCPFSKLTCLKINTSGLKPTYRLPTIPEQVRNYLLENSPDATFIMDLPPQVLTWRALCSVSHKRYRQPIPDDTMANKVAKLDAKIQMQDEVITEQKTMLEAAKLQHEKLVSYILKCKISELKLQVESGNPDYECIRSMGYDIKSVMDCIPESLRVAMVAQFFSQYEEVKSLLHNRIDSAQWANIETELGKIRDSEGTLSNNNHSQSDVCGAS